MCRAAEILGEHRVVPVVAVGGLVPELAVTAGSGCAALGQLGEGAGVAVEGLQARLGFLGVCLGWDSSGFFRMCLCVCELLLRSHGRNEAGEGGSDHGAFGGLCVVPER